MKTIFTLFALLAALQLSAQIFTQKKDFPQPLERSFSFMVDGKVYAGTGRDATGEMNNHIWQFDPATNLWVQKMIFPPLLSAMVFRWSLTGLLTQEWAGTVV